MTALQVLKAIHLLAAGVWTGGLIVLAVLVFTMMRAKVERPVIQAAARAFARTSWTAMVVAVLTGVGQVDMLHLDWGNPRLSLKLGFVVAAAGLAALHQGIAKDAPPVVGRIFEGLVLLASLGIFFAASRII